MKTRIYLLDRCPIIRLGFAQVINREKDLGVCGESADLKGAGVAIAALKPDIVLVNVSRDCVCALDGYERISKALNKVRILMYAFDKDVPEVRRLLRKGVRGYFTLDIEPKDLVEAIGIVREGHVYVPQTLKAGLMPAVGRGGAAKGVAADPLSSLTDREYEILKMIAAAKSVREIAKRLHRSHKTVQTHRDNIRAKLGFDSARRLLCFAIRQFHRFHG